MNKGIGGEPAAGVGGTYLHLDVTDQDLVTEALRQLGEREDRLMC